MRPIVKIGLVILIIAIIGLIIYFVWSALQAPAPEVPEAPPVGSELPAVPGTGGENGAGENGGGTEVPPAALSKISENPVFDFWIDAQTKEIYYLDSEGRVFSGKNGPDLQITQQRLSAPNFIELSPNGQRVLAAFGDPRLPQWGIFDVVDESWRPLPDGILNATWGENSSVLVGFVKNGANVNLSSVSVAQNEPVYKIINKDVRFQEVGLELLSSQNLVISENSSANYPARVWNLNLKDQSLSQMFSPENGLILKVSEDKKILLVFSPANGFRILNAPDLSLATPVPFSTLPSKCSPGSAVIYCFVPRDGFEKNSNLPDDYFQKRLRTDDILYKIDAGSDEISQISLPAGAGPIDAKNPRSFDGKLYFMNGYDNSLYSLNLN
jgi:hypothetical protein